ncbi:daunorubicin resistance protein DrrA family ABC transporter ATP-binding protein [Conexibacter woesei]|uniref:Daunorubicin resistance ABC transporter ATPase subunit n=1 Tax=Conexibacter woesei (strain DSM 14684 / CCUG 47730 / CIP 108061 / JCM 11494 / NBRC 100937 / ID131577) TaxID=469383 RepID=D3F1T7_CONWI|nr:daunorubicin resistance protein DrrA family ABC transporter ATP-binding protein [Conexibacter woesei]ADB54118.1 daunorubicin resistance ABC transporter ATPase subunit [Conexibacter woesei DSM 14684]
MPTTRLAIVAEGLHKRYGETNALDGIDLAVPEGTVMGLLGPNGAGKTTAVRILSTLLRRDGGRAEVAGYDVTTQARQVRSQIGLTGQTDAIDEILSGRQNLIMFGRLHHLSPREARVRADELLEQFGLTEAADRQARGYSGGMKRRLDLAASFITRPRVLFLDEPTTGQDPRNRMEVWTTVRGLVAGGTTVLLTTHYLDEADQLADQISVIDRGRVIANGTPNQLKSRLGGSQVDLVLRDPDDLPDAAAIVARVSDGEPDVDLERRRVSAPVGDRVASLTEILRALQDARVAVEDVALRQPTLDEVFLRLTGHGADDSDGADGTRETTEVTA